MFHRASVSLFLGRSTLATLLAVAALPAADSLASENIRLTDITVEPVRSGVNLLPNPGFEEGGSDGIPSGWQWGCGKTDATCRIDQSVAHSGRQSLKLTNSTTFGPHVYGMLWLKQPIRLTAGKHYTMSLWAKSDAPGVMNLVGGAQWQHRVGVLATAGQWRRIWKTFIATVDDREFTIRINTESPTDGVWLDGVKVEEGDTPTADRLDRPGGSAWIGVDDEAGSIQGDGSFRRAMLLSNSQAIAGQWNAALSGAESFNKAANVPPGNWRVWLHGESASASEAVRTLSVRIVASDKLVAAVETPLRIYSPKAAFDRLDAIKKQLVAMKKDMETVKSRGLDISYPDATYTVLENFVGFVEEDARGQEVKRAYDQIADMEGMAKRLRAELDDVLAGKRSLPAVPRWTAEKRPVVRGSSFVASTALPNGEAAERPVFFNGFGHFGRVVTDMERWPHYGTNIIQIEFGPSRVFPADGQTSDAPVREMLAILDRAQKAKVAVCLLISPHYFPQWALNKWPHLNKRREGFLQYCLHAPEGRELLQRYVAAAIAPLKDHPALHSICISNEPINVEEPCDAAKKLWAEWLQKRHGDLKTLNSRYGTKFTSFVEVPLPDPLGKRPEPPQWMDFVRFNQEFFADWHKMLADAVHKAAPHVPIHAKAMTWTMITAPDVRFGVDAYLFGQFSTINGNDSANMYLFGEGEFAQSWVLNAGAYDLQRSVLDAPVFNSENHVITDRDLREVPASHIRSVLWQGAVHGQSATTVWVWERTSDMKSDLAGSIMIRPACAEAVGIANLDLNRAALEVTALQQARPEVLILHSTTASVWDAPSYDYSLEKLYTALSFTGLKIGFITERQLEAGIQPEASTIFIPGVKHLSDAALATLRKHQGRLVFVGDGDPITHDDYGRARNPDLQVEKFLLATNASSKDVCRRIVAKLPEWNLHPQMELREVDRLTAWGVAWRSVETPKGVVLNVCNYRKTPVTVAVTQQGKSAALVNILTDERTTGPITLAPMEVRLLRANR